MAGATTNVDDAEKDLRVRAYASDYQQMRGVEFANLAPERIRLFGTRSAHPKTAA